MLGVLAVNSFTMFLMRASQWLVLLKLPSAVLTIEIMPFA